MSLKEASGGFFPPKHLDQLNAFLSYDRLAHTKTFLSIFHICHPVCKKDYVRKKPKHKDENAYADNAYKFVVVDVVIDDDAINKL